MTTLLDSLANLGISRVISETLFDSFSAARSAINELGLNLSFHYKLLNILTDQIDQLCTHHENGGNINSVREYRILTFIIAILNYRIYFLEGIKFPELKKILLVQAIAAKYPSDCKLFCESLQLHRSTGVEYIKYLFNGDTFQASERPIYPNVISPNLMEVVVHIVDDTWKLPLDMPATSSVVSAKITDSTIFCGLVNGRALIGSQVDGSKYGWAEPGFMLYSVYLSSNSNLKIHNHSIVFTPEQLTIHPILLGRFAIMQELVLAGFKLLKADPGNFEIYCALTVLVSNLNTLHHVGPPSLLELTFLQALRGKSVACY